MLAFSVGRDSFYRLGRIGLILVFLYNFEFRMFAVLRHCVHSRLSSATCSSPIHLFLLILTPDRKTISSSNVVYTGLSAIKLEVDHL